MIRSPLTRHFVLSPNIGVRVNEAKPDMVILHYTGMKSAEAARAWLCNPESGVSCHYLVDEDGYITQMVGEEMRAWHAGASSWEGETDINSRSIGIEIQNPGHTLGYRAFPEEQMKAVIALVHDIMARNDISSSRVLAHSDVAPGRKIDPGELFDWAWLHREGIGDWIEPAPPDDTPAEITPLQAALERFGYGIEVTGIADARTEAVVSAFQRHYRPARFDGVADMSTLQTLQRLLRASGKDREGR
ncbi:N-acetylmuramoyl-L-alanine amidase [Aestuariivirga sp.]|uniref:N-acetylmuramoyl-L-alanine amidase n=1 Tax=Aestuariivirga sp. TaxID=2650926 RepID=UPI0039E54EF1